MRPFFPLLAVLLVAGSAFPGPAAAAPGESVCSQIVLTGGFYIGPVGPTGIGGTRCAIPSHLPGGAVRVGAKDAPTGLLRYATNVEFGRAAGGFLGSCNGLPFEGVCPVPLGSEFMVIYLPYGAAATRVTVLEA